MYRIKMEAYEGKEPYIFVSYSHRDADDVLPILDQLHNQHYRIWYDDGVEAGSEWPAYIEKHLKNASAVLAFISPNAVKSANCRREITFALDKNIPLSYVLLEKTELAEGMSLQLAGQYCIDRTRIAPEKFMKKIMDSSVFDKCRSTPDEKPEEDFISEDQSEASSDNPQVNTAVTPFEPPSTAPVTPSTTDTPTFIPDALVKKTQEPPVSPVTPVTLAPEDPGKWVCKECETENKGCDLYCSCCGAANILQVPRADKKSDNGKRTVSVSSQKPDKTQKDPISGPKPKSKGSKAAVITVVAVVAILAVVVAVMIRRTDGSSAVQTSDSSVSNNASDAVSWVSEEFQGGTTLVWYPKQLIENCTKVQMTFQISKYEGNLPSVWKMYYKDTDDQWHVLSYFPVSNSGEVVQVESSPAHPITIKAMTAYPSDSQEGWDNIVWNANYNFEIGSASIQSDTNSAVDTPSETVSDTDQIPLSFGDVRYSAGAWNVTALVPDSPIQNCTGFTLCYGYADVDPAELGEHRVYTCINLSGNAWLEAPRMTISEIGEIYRLDITLDKARNVEGIAVLSVNATENPYSVMAWIENVQYAN